MIFDLIDDKDAAMRTVELLTGPFAVVRPKYLDGRRLPQLITRYWTFENWLVGFHMRMLPREFERHNNHVDQPKAMQSILKPFQRAYSDIL
jgi:hypothetical protein